MKKYQSKNLLKAAIISLSLISSILSGCSSAHQRESTGEYIDSSVITTKVKAKLLADDFVHSLPITVKTYKNVVQLSGFVNTRFQKQRAIDDAASVEGVAAVHDSLIIKHY